MAGPAPTPATGAPPRTRHTVAWTTRDDQIADDAAGDGCFPLITNDRPLTETQVLAAYRYQLNLERRHHLLKSVQDADPIWLRDPARLEATFCCQFLALLVGALTERPIRTAMKAVPPPTSRSTPSYAPAKRPPPNRSSPSSPT